MSRGPKGRSARRDDQALATGNGHSARSLYADLGEPLDDVARASSTRGAIDPGRARGAIGSGRPLAGAAAEAGSPIRVS